MYIYIFQFMCIAKRLILELEFELNITERRDYLVCTNL